MSDIGVNHRTLYEIADDLTIYFDNLELATTDEEAAEFQAQIDLMGGELVQKADNIAGVIRRINAEVALISAEEERLTERRILFEKAVAWLTAYTMRVMQERGMTQIKSPTVTLRLQGNGGVQPLLTTEELADEFKDITVKMPLELFRRSVELDDVIYQAKMVALEPSQPRIREALAKPCENCDGAGGFMDQGVDLDNPPEFNACDRCHGTGKATVAGAELKPRGYQLEDHVTGHQRFIVIMTIVLGLMALAAFTALGKVEEKTSYGLTGILLILGQVIAAVFKNEKGTPEESEPKEPQ